MSLLPWQQRVAQELGKGYDISFTPNVLKKQPKDKLFNELKLQMRGSVADAANQRMPLVAEL